MKPLSRAAIEAMNKIQTEVFLDIIHELNLYEYAIVTKFRNIRSWMDGVEQKVNQLKLTSREEIHCLEQLGRSLGINPKPYDNRPYYDFLEAIYNGLQATKPHTMKEVENGVRKRISL